jgi:uncharacterized membrane protein
MVLAIFLLFVIVVVVVASLIAAPGFRSARGRMRWAMALVYVGFGFFHVVASDRFLPIMPPILPFPTAIIIATGFCEIAGGLGLLAPATRRSAGIALAVYAVCVYPANLYHAYGHVIVPDLPSSWWYHAPRLLFQPVLIWWALFSGQVIDWPFAPHRPAFAREQADATETSSG